MINPEVAVPLALVVAAPVLLAYRWFQYRERIAAISADASRPTIDAERLARLEQAMEAVAVEIERVGEGQRYLTRVLGDSPSGRLSRDE